MTFVGRLEAPKRRAVADRDGASVAGNDCPTAICCWWARARCDLPWRRRAGAAGIAERVHFAGWRTDVPEILAASSLLVLPSAWEGMPNVVLEAMASRLPVVATDVEGVRELLGPAAARQTVRYGDTKALIDKVVSFICDPVWQPPRRRRKPPPGRGEISPFRGWLQPTKTSGSLVTG